MSKAVFIAAFKARKRIGVCALILACATLAATAQDISSQTPEDVRLQLEQVQSSISLSRERADALRAEIEAMEGDRTRQSAALIASAQRVKSAEAEVAVVETKLFGLLEEEGGIRGRLDGADEKVAQLLTALQRISKSPPPALIVDPEDALGSARGAMLLASVLPQLRARAGGISDDLQRLVTVRQSVENEKDILRGNLSTLLEEQLRTATLIEARKRGAAIIGVDLAGEEEDARALAEQAQSLTELIDQLSKKISSVAKAANDAEQTSVSGLSRADILTALANTERKEPAVPFADTKGFLTLPATGVVVTDYGANDGFGGISRGVSMVTRKDAQIVAPADGWVMYKGPYLNYGEIVIINPGFGYSILLAGLVTSSVELGQFVIMGEPIGTMGSRTIGRAVTTSAGVSRPTLYIELRNEDTPLNPEPWWAEKERQVQNG